MHPQTRIAVVLFNLGGPDSLQAVKPFLFNLFNDPHILRLPKLVRNALAWIISRRRQKEAQDIYSQIGGYSPLLKNTLAQANALQERLGEKYKVFVSMRYWHPFVSQTIKEVQAWKPDKIVLLPLYPQFSTTTTQSSLIQWHETARRMNCDFPTSQIGCYPFHPDFLKFYRNALLAVLRNHKAGSCRVLFSAHGLPRKIVDQGDPYAWQVERGVEKLVDSLQIKDLEWRVCYQSRVGPVEWVKPYTDHEILAAAQEKKGIIVVPVAFVSEHSETLVELDIQYRKLALENGAPFYERIPAAGSSPEFIECLKDLVLNKVQSSPLCPEEYKTCICRKVF